MCQPSRAAARGARPSGRRLCRQQLRETLPQQPAQRRRAPLATVRDKSPAASASERARRSRCGRRTLMRLLSRLDALNESLQWF